MAQNNMTLKQKLNSTDFGFLKVIKKVAISCFRGLEKGNFLMQQEYCDYLKIIKSTSKICVMGTQKYYNK